MSMLDGLGRENPLARQLPPGCTGDGKDTERKHAHDDQGSKMLRHGFIDAQRSMLSLMICPVAYTPKCAGEGRRERTIGKIHIFLLKGGDVRSILAQLECADRVLRVSRS
jgi:hypothetical protein